MKIIECVPNFSEGKNQDTFDAITNAVNKIEGAKLLSLEPDADYNRVVVTLAGNENGILEGAIAASKAAAVNIDMRNHKGEHPRLGAIDVVPFIPVKNISTQECIKISERYAERISKELEVPVYLYEEAARHPSRKLLSNIRKGEYEGLEEKLKNPEWFPDFGEAKFNPKLGAIVTGVRFFLIAYNVNIKSSDVKFAKEISEVLRESGRPKRDENGNVIKVNGETIKIPGKLKTVQGMGVSLEKYSITQVSMNLKNYFTTPLHIAFEEVKKEAERLGVEVNGSEIVGLVPLEALMMAGKYYSNNNISEEKALVELAIEKLGLSSLNKFDPEKKIIDYMI
ncbi:MAG: glutamate formimidoyltransferase [Ignavibacteriales bacterium]|nr:glutamate formimidoyltransferase [Ignavibacteriales bacterium]